MKHEEVFANAKWIEAPAALQSPLFRKSFALQKAVDKAEITIIGLGTFDLYINGCRVGEELYPPLHSDYHACAFEIKDKPFDEVTAHRLYACHFDITDLLQTDENVLGVWLAPGWYADRLQIHFGNMKLCFCLTLTSGDKTEHIVSDESMLCHESRITDYIFTEGETHDFAKDIPDWHSIGCITDDWQPVTVTEIPETEIYLQSCPGDKVMRSINPKLLHSDGVRRIYDAGENHSGYPILQAAADSSGEVLVRVSEELLPDGSLDEERGYRQYVSYRLDGKPHELKPLFTWLAYRYFEVVGEAEVVRCDVVHADIVPRAAFSSNSMLLNWLFDAYLKTQLANMHRGIPSDCPHEERRGYTGDGQLTCECAMLLLNSQSFYKKWIGDIADCQDRLTGHVQYTAPYRHSGGGPGGWGCAIVAVPYVYYKTYGDAEPFRQLYPQMLHYFSYLENHSENHLVTSDKEGEWSLGDWCTPEELVIPEPFVNTYFFVRSIDMMLDMHRVIGRENESNKLAALRRTLCDAIDKAYYDPSTGNYADNKQGANAFALDIGLGDERTYENMLMHYQNYGMYDTGIFGTEIVTRLLFERGEAELAYQLLTSEKPYSFHHMMQHGATTLWEYWTGERSRLHPMFGAVTKLLHQYILGIRQEKESCGYQKLLIEPARMSALSHAEGSVNLPDGTVFVSRDMTPTSIVFVITLPNEREVHFVYGNVDTVLTGGTHTIEIKEEH